MCSALFIAFATLAFAAPNGGPALNSQYTVATISLSDAREISTSYRLAIVKRARGACEVHTVSSEGELTQGEQVVRFRSDRPEAEDPWPLVLQHAVASVPALLRCKSGAPPGPLLSASDWRAAAERAVSEAPVPNGLQAGGEALLDPDGLLADLGRTFPALPTLEWVRQERVGQLAVVITESCTGDPAGAGLRCEGVAAAAPGQEARLDDSHTWTQMTADRRGIISMESHFDAVLVWLRPRDGQVVESAVASRRLVVRE